MALGDPFVALPGGFVSLSEALDLTTASGRALAGMLAVFAEFEARHSARPGQGRDCASPPRRTASRTPRHRPPPRRRHPQAPPGRRQQKRDRQASERQPNLSPTAAGALAYKNFRFLRSPLDAVYVAPPERRLGGVDDLGLGMALLLFWSCGKRRCGVQKFGPISVSLVVAVNELARRLITISRPFL